MNRNDLKKKMCDRFPHIQKTDIDMLVHYLFHEIETGLAKGEQLNIRGIGTIKTQIRKAKAVQDITRGKGFYIPERKTLKILPSKKLIEKLNKTP